MVARAAREAPPPPQDRLDAVKEAVRRARDLELEMASTKEKLKADAAALDKLVHEELPDLFSQAGMISYALEAEGNLPAYEAKAKPYYYANIAANWDEERRQAAFDWLARPLRDPGDDKSPDGGGAPDLVKTQIVIELGRGDQRLAEKIEAGLRKAKVPYVTRLAVPWNTLTAFVREMVEVKKRMPPLDLLGATVGRVVAIKALEQEERK